MFLNTLKNALNNVMQNKLYAVINILGLAVGMAACLLISLFVHYELNYDSDFAEANRIYRLSPDFAATAQGPERRPAGNVAPLAPLLAESGIQDLSAIARIGGMPALITTDDQVYREDNVRWADPALFDIFQLQWLQGDSSTALRAPDSVVISAEMARKYFGDEEPLGQTLMLENTWPLTVSGVIADLPSASHLSADFIVSMQTAWKMLDFDYSANWSYPNFHTYVKLQAGADISVVMDQIAEEMVASADQINPFFNITAQSFGLTAYPLQDIHLSSDRDGEFRTPGNAAFVATFSVIALCLLLIACINFMNLSTARAARRAKEVGMRKTIGASRSELIRQFMGESFLTTLFALVLALLLVELLLPVFASLIQRDLVFSTLLQPGFLLFMCGATVLTALMAGSYPAFYLSAFKPIKVLAMGRFSGEKGLSVRNVLVVVQFFLAISLLVCTAVVYQQLNYARNLDLGFNKDEIIVLRGTSKEGLGSQWEVLQRELLQHPGVLSIAEGDMTPGSVGSRHVRIEGGQSSGFDIQSKQVGFDFLATYDIALIAGRDFDETLGTDIFYPPFSVTEGQQPTGSYVLNAAAVRALGLSPEEVLHRNFEVDWSGDFSVAVKGPVIGVVEDVHTHSLRQPIQPLVYFVPTETWGNQPSFNIASVRISGNNVAQTVDFIAEQWARFTPAIPFQYQFLDADYVELYQDETRQGKLFSLFALLTVFIACMGLYGLVSFTVERRRKEIGVRKVMGGSVMGIVVLLTNDFSKLVLLSNLIAWPVAYFAMNRWLENFAYRIDLTPLVFIGSGLIALCIAWVTVGGTAAKAASQKPVLALRYE